MKKYIIYPSLLAIADRKNDWKQEIQKVEDISTGVHYDIGDGIFVPSLMLDPLDIPLAGESLPIDVHLMVEKPSEYFPKILQFPTVSAVAFHVETSEDIHQNIQTLKNAGKKVGLALLDITPAHHLDAYLLEIDYVLVMTVKGGYSGTPFIPEMLQKIKGIHNKSPELPIIVDGGVGEKTFLPCLEAGAIGAVMSSAVFKSEDISWLN